MGNNKLVRDLQHFVDKRSNSKVQFVTMGGFTCYFIYLF